jgi:D-alanine-D-alanine ligase
MSQMPDQKKLRVLVLYGGRSVEHEVSLQSAASVVKHLDATRFEVMPVGIDKQGRWLVDPTWQAKLQQPAKSLSLPAMAHEVILPPYPCVRDNQHLSIDAAGFALMSVKAAASIKPFDVIFPVLHGPLGEDGTLQGLLEMVDVPFVGAGVLSSAVIMDKEVAKRLILAAGLPTVPYIVLRDSLFNQQSPADYEAMVETQLGYPVFVKPANLGSSVGIHKVKKASELYPALQDAFRYDTKVLIEKGISGREIEVSVLENPAWGQPPLVSIPGEIVPTHEFYSYEAKYIDENGAQLLIPSSLDPEQVKVAQRLAKKAFEVLNCEGMARVDLFFENETGQFYYNEANSIPGFTNISMYPKLWEASGLSYPDLLTTLIELAMARHARKRALKRDWF